MIHITIFIIIFSINFAIGNIVMSQYLLQLTICILSKDLYGVSNIDMYNGLKFSIPH